MKKNILLIHPPINKECLTTGFIMNPYALELLAVGLQESFNNNLNIKIIDFRLENYSKGLKEISEFRPYIVGIPGLTTDFPAIVNILNDVKSISKSIITVVGGHHATISPSDFFIDSVDVIVLGPGIETFKEIVQIDNLNELEFIKGIIYKNNENVFIHNKPRDNFEELKNWPLPAYNLTEKYRRKNWSLGRNHRIVSTSQGCVYRCTFCSCWKVMNGKYIKRDPESVVREIENAPENIIYFGDDLTFLDIDRMVKIAEFIKAKNIRKKYRAYARTDIIVKYVEAFKLWKEIGLISLTTGMEAISDEDLNLYNKKTNIEINEKANKILLDLGIYNNAHFLIKPEYKKTDFDLIEKYIHKLGIAYPILSVLTPFPGTIFHDNVENEIFPKDYQYRDCSHPIVKVKNQKEVKEFYRNYKRLYNKIFSFKRWLICRIKCIINIITKKNIFKKEEINTPSLILIFLFKIIVRLQFNKTKKFIKLFPK